MVTQKLAAKLLSVSRVTVWRLTKDGVLHPVEIFPGTWRYPYAEIAKLAAAGSQAGVARLEPGGVEPRNAAVVSGAEAPEPRPCAQVLDQVGLGINTLSLILLQGTAPCSEDFDASSGASRTVMVFRNSDWRKKLRAENLVQNLGKRFKKNCPKLPEVNRTKTDKAERSANA